MKRVALMLRCLKPHSIFNFVALLSLLLGLFILACWSDSHIHARQLTRQSGDLETMLVSDSGKLNLQTTRGGATNQPASWRYYSGPARIWGGAHLMSDWYGRFGFGHVTTTYIITVKFTVTQTWIPYWSLAALTAILPMMWAMRLSRKYLATRRARLVGLCPRCHYDLRASPTRCPECGFEKASLMHPPPSPQ